MMNSDSSSPGNGSKQDVREHDRAKQPYNTPRLQSFGRVTELTQAATGNCAGDGVGNNCTPSPNAMAMD